jgi:hypothetical protein
VSDQLGLGERFSVLRDEALNCAQYGDSAPGSELFEAIMATLVHLGETEPGLNHSLQDALSRRIAWGDDASTIAVDCDIICQRLLAATSRSFPDPGEASVVISVITEVTCTASRHLARLAVQRASQERALERREMMVQRQLAAALSQQDELIRALTDKLNS